MVLLKFLLAAPVAHVVDESMEIDESANDVKKSAEKAKKQLPPWVPTPEVVQSMSLFQEQTAKLFNSLSPADLKMYQKGVAIPLELENSLFALHEVVDRHHGNKVYKTTGYLEALCSTIKDRASIDFNTQKMKKVIQRICTEKDADNKAREIDESVAHLKSELLHRISVAQPNPPSAQSTPGTPLALAGEVVSIQIDEASNAGVEAVANSATEVNTPEVAAVAAKTPMKEAPEKWECRWTAATRNAVLDITDKAEVSTPFLMTVWSYIYSFFTCRPGYCWGIRGEVG
jgi:hypothetical protein